ncbi:MAG: ABC transporter ATP-binding protein [SAR202 cluster bacterium]|nr:ABC transporter ATP-binding protein [SAR202 cluster bacterium]|tara:strand:- start:1924 stop:2862 length:939 start_codon:yes stop_codon:yes gene_type:complete
MIKVDNVTKFYGEFPAITNLSFEVPKGEILGFLGPNGAGKSTTMKILTGFMPPSSGTVEIAGFDILEESLNARKHIGYLPETVPLYLEMNVSEYLSFMGQIRGMNSKKITQRISEVVEICSLQDYYKTIIGKLSKGYKQRVGISQAILHEPDVLVLDEPTIGIDPIQVVETRQLIKGLGEAHTLILSSHILPEVSMICDRVIIINEGQIAAVDNPKNLGTNLSGVERVEIEIKGPNQEIIPVLEKVDHVNAVERVPITGSGYHRYQISVDVGSEIRSQLASVVLENQWELLKLQSIGMSLEEIFLKITVHEE